MRTLTLAMALVAAGCSTTPQYQGDVVLGAFSFNGTVLQDTCNLLDGGFAAGGFAFVGVLSYDSAKQELFLDTDGDPKDDHVGSLSGRHFVLTNSAQRETHCNYPVNVVETLQGDLLDVPGGCASLLPDGGLPDGGGVEPFDGGVKDLSASVACGTVIDVSADATDGGVLCGGCTLSYQLTATLQTSGGSP
ncbi:MAG: hypothetical protein JST54_08460 [Deltaproteobacteria bacterium]|nr:hypothetical protein [Deltaproteobacteria bacterium]